MVGGCEYDVGVIGSVDDQAVSRPTKEDVLDRDGIGEDDVLNRRDRLRFEPDGETPSTADPEWSAADRTLLRSNVPGS